MTPGEVEHLLDGWRSAERALDGSTPDTAEYADLTLAVKAARDAYLEAVLDRARQHGYAGGTRTVHDDIEQLREAEDRRESAEPSTPGYHQAAQDVQERAFRIVDQVAEDEQRAEAEKLQREGDGIHG